jgi:FlaA1/EpsC-like NDP-sugar epimerase
VAGNSYAGGDGCRFSVVRYGNVMGSRGSVIPFFMSLDETAPIPITDPRMTRFMITLDQGVELVWHAFEDSVGGEIYVKKIPSMDIMQIAEAVRPGFSHEVVGIRPGEKLHEQMIGPEDAPHTYEYDEHFKIIPAIHNWSMDPARIKDGRKVAEDFRYASDNNTDWMAVDALRDWIAANRDKVGRV